MLQFDETFSLILVEIKIKLTRIAFKFTKYGFAAAPQLILQIAKAAGGQVRVVHI